LLISLRHDRRSGPACYLATEPNNRNRPAMSRVWRDRLGARARRRVASFCGEVDVATRWRLRPTLSVRFRANRTLNRHRRMTESDPNRSSVAKICCDAQHSSYERLW
jgi:hypothetical protein